MSLRINCSCKLMVCVETTTRHSLSRERRLDGGDEVGERFADAGAGFDHEMPAVRDGALDRGGHGELLRPALEIGKATGDRPVGTENGVTGHFSIVDCLVVGWLGGFCRQPPSHLTT